MGIVFLLVIMSLGSIVGWYRCDAVNVCKWQGVVEIAIFCAKCGEARKFPMSSVRSTRAPCDYCGGFDKLNLTRDGMIVRQQNLLNYSYPTSLLPTVTEQETEAGVD